MTSSSSTHRDVAGGAFVAAPPVPGAAGRPAAFNVLASLLDVLLLLRLTHARSIGPRLAVYFHALAKRSVVLRAVMAKLNELQGAAVWAYAHSGENCLKLVKQRHAVGQRGGACDQLVLEHASKVIATVANRQPDSTNQAFEVDELARKLDAARATPPLGPTPDLSHDAAWLGPAHAGILLQLGGGSVGAGLAELAEFNCLNFALHEPYATGTWCLSFARGTLWPDDEKKAQFRADMKALAGGD